MVAVHVAYLKLLISLHGYVVFPTFLFGSASLKFLFLYFDSDLVVLHAAEKGAPCAGTQP